MNTMCMHTKPVCVRPKAISQNILPGLPSDFSPKVEKDPSTWSETVSSRFIDNKISPLMTRIEHVPNSHPEL